MHILYVLTNTCDFSYKGAIFHMQDQKRDPLQKYSQRQGHELDNLFQTSIRILIQHSLHTVNLQKNIHYLSYIIVNHNL
jgi:hypothetical protein